MKRNSTKEVEETTIKCAKNVSGEAESNISFNHTNEPNKYHISNGIYFVKIPGLDTNVSFLTFTLSELINRINPILSIHFNYCIDPDFLIRHQFI